MDRPRLVSTALVAALLASGFVAGCSDDDPEPNLPDPTPSASTSTASASTSPTVTQPVGLSPEDTVRAWVDDWNEGLQTGETASVRSHQDVNCRGCDNLVGPVEQIYAAGGHFEGGLWSVSSLQLEGRTGGEADVNLAVAVAAGQTIPSAGAEPTSYPATKHILRFSLAESKAGWKVTVIELLS